MVLLKGEGGKRQKNLLVRHWQTVDLKKMNLPVASLFKGEEGSLPVWVSPMPSGVFQCLPMSPNAYHCPPVSPHAFQCPPHAFWFPNSSQSAGSMMPPGPGVQMKERRNQYKRSSCCQSKKCQKQKRCSPG